MGWKSTLPRRHMQNLDGNELELIQAYRARQDDGDYAKVEAILRRLAEKHEALCARRAG